MTEKQLPFQGAATALITPFHAQDPTRIDEAVFVSLVKRQCDAGIAALVTAGTTGEASALSREEHIRLITLAKQNAPNRIPVIAGCGAPTTERAVSLVRDAEEAGADAVLIVTPYYNKCSQEGLYRHYATIADATRLPLILYEVPSRTGLHVTPDTYIRLAAHPNIVALKDATGDLERMSLLRHRTGNALHLYSGADGVNVPMMALGAHGVISVLSNLCPEAVVVMCDCCRMGDYLRAAALQCRYAPLIRALFSEVNPIPVKSIMAHLGLCADTFRLPLCRLDPSIVAEMAQLIPGA